MGLKSVKTFIRGLAGKPISNERRSTRTACEIRCYLFNADGLATAGVIMDSSAGGVKIKCDRGDAHDRAAYVLRMDTGAAFALRLAWRVGPFAGYEFRQRLDLRLRSCDMGASAIKAAWQEHLQARTRSPISTGAPNLKG